MPLSKTILLANLILLLPASCGSTGWLPSVTLGLAGIARGQNEQDQRDRAFHLQADARLNWRLQLSPASRATAGTGSAVTEYENALERPRAARPCDWSALCTWEEQERIRALRAAESD